VEGSCRYILSTFPALRRARVTEYESGWSSEPVRTLRRWEEYLTRSENGNMICPGRIPVTIPAMQFRLRIRPRNYRQDCPNFWGAINPVPFWRFSFSPFYKEIRNHLLAQRTPCPIICWLTEHHVPSELHSFYKEMRNHLLAHRTPYPIWTELFLHVS
jgi:hypothetical protein